MNAEHRRVIVLLAGLTCALAPNVAEAKRVVYINTEPITVLAGDNNDPASDTIAVGGYTATSFAGWNGASEEQQQELLYLLKETTLHWDVVFTLERPATGPYDMIVFGDAADHASAFGGACSPQVGIADCEDQGGVSISFLFWGCLEESKQFDPHRVAFSVLGALGYSWGMDNISVTGQVMGSYANFGLKYGDTCVPVSGTSNCTHQLCPAGQQNGTAEMVARHGVRVDDGPPELIVLEPAANAVISGPFDVKVEILDDFGGLSAELAVVGFDAPPAVDDKWPFAWKNIELPPGSHTLEITATDVDGGQTSTQVPICVGMCDESDEGGADQGDPDDEGGGPGGTDDGDDDLPDSDGGQAFMPIGGDEATVGCGCTTQPRGSAWGGLAALALLGLLRRRRA